MKKGIATAACAAVITAGLTLAAANATAAPKMVKCYGVAKAGKNDCGGKGANHACQGHATKNADKYDWIYVPKGLCNKIAGGSLKSGDKG